MCFSLFLHSALISTSTGTVMGLLKVLWKTTKDFFRESSISGLNNAFRASSFARAFYWIVVFTVGFVLTVVSFSNLVNDFYSFPVTTNSDLERRNRIEFPAVTVCNLNRINCYNLFEELLNRTSHDELAVDSEYNQTLSNLKAIFETTGCFFQICRELNHRIPDVRTSNASDLYVEYDILLCANNEERNCNHLLLMKEDPNFNQIEKFNEFWTEASCTLELACNFGYRMEDKKALPSECPPQADVPDFPSGPRQKRSNEKVYIHEDLIAEDDFIREFTSLPPDVLRSIGHRFEDSSAGVFGENKGFIKECTYRGISCKNKDYWYLDNLPGYGNCYTFNSAYNPSDYEAPRHSSVTGVINGLSIEVFLDQGYYMLNKLSKQAGARIVIHKSSMHPSPDEYGFDVRPNTANSIAIQMNDISRLPHPFQSNCTNWWNQTGYDMDTFSNREMEYSLATCQSYCIQLAVIKKCGCYHFYLDTSRINLTKFTLEDGKPIPACSVVPLSTNKNHECFTHILSGYAEHDQNCLCRTACSEVEYTSTLSVSTWPSNQYWVDLAVSSGFPLLKIQGKDRSQIQNAIQTNYLKANIYYQTLNVQTIKQIPKYDKGTIFSGLGGALSFYLGAAIIMLFEVFEYFYDIIFKIIECLTAKKKRISDK